MLFVLVQNIAVHSQLDDILKQGVYDGVYPAVAAAAMSIDGKINYIKAFGNLNYSDLSPPVSVDTIFDLASLSKVVATTTAVALLYQHGLLALDDKVSKYLGSEFSAQGKGSISIRNCLLHNAGFPPDPSPWYWAQEFNCPNTTPDESIVPNEDFSCLEQIYSHLLNTQKLQSVPGETYVYSDLSFISLQLVVGSIAWSHGLVTRSDFREECIAVIPPKDDHKEYGDTKRFNTTGTLLSCSFEALVRTRVFNYKVYKESAQSSTSSTLMPRTSYLLSINLHSSSAPTLNDTGVGSYTHTRIQGHVSDGDCYAMGGLCGHAGVFSTVKDVASFLKRLLQSISSNNDADYDADYDVNNTNMDMRKHATSGFVLNATTLRTFTAIYNETQSSRALGWSTNNPNVKDFGFDQSCGSMSMKTFMHTGYTGGCICVDPDNKLFSVVLTNRVYNCQGQLCPAGSSDPVKAIYKAFNTAIINLVDL